MLYLSGSRVSPRKHRTSALKSSKKNRAAGMAKAPRSTDSPDNTKNTPATRSVHPSTAGRNSRRLIRQTWASWLTVGF